jgi:hypothetical protein
MQNSNTVKGSTVKSDTGLRTTQNSVVAVCRRRDTNPFSIWDYNGVYRYKYEYSEIKVTFCYTLFKYHPN